MAGLAFLAFIGISKVRIFSRPLLFESHAVHQLIALIARHLLNSWRLVGSVSPTELFLQHSRFALSVAGMAFDYLGPSRTGPGSEASGCSSREFVALPE